MSSFSDEDFSLDASDSSVEKASRQSEVEIQTESISLCSVSVQTSALKSRGVTYKISWVVDLLNVSVGRFKLIFHRYVHLFLKLMILAL